LVIFVESIDGPWVVAPANPRKEVQLALQVVTSTILEDGKLLEIIIQQMLRDRGEAELGGRESITDPKAQFMSS
jgi:hypothetical protein